MKISCAKIDAFKKICGDMWEKIFICATFGRHLQLT